MGVLGNHVNPSGRSMMMKMITRQLASRTAEPDSAKPRAGSNGRQRRWSSMWSRKSTPSIPDRRVRSDCGCRSPFGEIAAEAGEQVLDVRHLPMRGQIGRTLERMESLPEGERLRHINTLVPWPLFAMLETRGYRYRLAEQNSGNVQVLIWRLDPGSRAEAGVDRSV